MENEEQKLNERKKKVLWIAPIVVLPFLTLLFWTMGGGTTEEVNAAQLGKQGLNMELPDANINEDPKDKLSYYDQATSDSAKLKDQMSDDPYHQLRGVATDSSAPLSYHENSSFYRSGNTSSSAATEQRVYEKLHQLQRTINTQEADQPRTKERDKYATERPAASPDIDRLEQMMQMVNKPAEPDQEMSQLNGMLDKILDIQNPQRVREQLKQQSAAKKGQVFAVSSIPVASPITLLEGEQQNKRDYKGGNAAVGNGFFSIGGNTTVRPDSQNAIEAIVFGTQSIISGALIKMQLVNSIYINGTMIPKGEFIYGKTTLNGERLEIKISSIGYRKSTFPVELTVCDLTGIEGIHVPGAIGRDVAKTSAEQGLQGIGFSTLDPSLGVQAASVGIEAAKSFLSKKVKRPVVTVKSDYRILLRDDKQK